MDTVTLTIDGIQVRAKDGTSVLDAARAANIYIPTLCSHLDLPSAGVCELCVVEIGGTKDLPAACETPIREGMVVQTGTANVQALRRDNLAKILATHPHACLICAQRQGCSRTQCSSNVAVPERCCDKFGRCEVQKVSEYIRIKQDTPRFIFPGLPIITDEPLFTRNYNLCIGCTRCVRVCRDVRGVGAVGVVYRGEERIVGPIGGPGMRESDCRFCTACVEVCPTGALLDKDLKAGDREAVLVPCKSACPAGIEVPRYVGQISSGKYSEAVATIREKVPFPAVLGHVCFHPCETECRRRAVNEPIAICSLKRFAAEHDDGVWKTRLKPVTPTGKRVAVVGSGPAGLTAAYFLARKGHAVTVLEALPEPGGMLRTGVPAYRLPIEVLKQEIDEIVAQGVEIKTNVAIGRDVALHDLRERHDAVFLAVGAQLSRRLNIDGSQLDGVLWGLDFLRDVRLRRNPEVGPRTVVIGGGNVAIDVALTALRAGAWQVQLACLESRAEMPAFEWEIQEAIEEGVVLNFSWGPKRVFGDGGKVNGIELVRCTAVFDADRRFNPTFDESVTTVLAADTIILAIGQATDLSLLEGNSRVETVRGSIGVDATTLATGAPGIFAGGEAVRSPSTVVESIAAGRKAAMSIDLYLGGDGNIEEKLAQSSKPNPYLGKVEGFAYLPRATMPTLPLDERVNSFARIDLGFDEAAAVTEAKRCLRCGLRLQISPPFLPPEEWLEFDAKNVASMPDVEGAYELLDADKMVIYIAGTINLRQGMEEQLQSNAKARYFRYEKDPMYTKRESELLQRFLQEHGRMPEGNDELDDLF